MARNYQFPFAMLLRTSAGNQNYNETTLHGPGGVVCNSPGLPPQTPMRPSPRSLQPTRPMIAVPVLPTAPGFDLEYDEIYFFPPDPIRIQVHFEGLDSVGYARVPNMTIEQWQEQLAPGSDVELVLQYGGNGVNLERPLTRMNWSTAR